MRVCPQCNSQVSSQTTVCSVCDLPLPANLPNYSSKPQNAIESEKICPSCNTNNSSRWVFCSNCGAPLANVAIKANNVSIKESKNFSEFEPTLLKQPEDKTKQHSLFNPSSDLAKLPENALSNKPLEGSLKDLIFCSVCGEANPKNLENCISCLNALTNTLAMGSQLSHPKLRLMKDSGENETYDITGDEFVIGRTQGNATFPQDNYMSSYHARIVRRDQRYFLVDEESKNGVYKRIKEELILKNGNIVLIGRQIFRFEQ